MTYTDECVQLNLRVGIRGMKFVRFMDFWFDDPGYKGEERYMTRWKYENIRCTDCNVKQGKIKKYLNKIDIMRVTMVTSPT